MYLVISSQVRIFALAVLLGAALALVYDVFRIYRILLSYTVTGIAIQDAAYFLIAGSSVLLFFMALNEGEIRLYAIGGIAFGAAVYFKTVSRLVVGKMGACLKRLKRKTAKKIAPIAEKYEKNLKKLKKHFKKRKKNSIIEEKKDVRRKKRGKTQARNNILSARGADSRLHRGKDISGSGKDRRKAGRTCRDRRQDRKDDDR